MNIQRNEWTVFSIYQRHSPSISFADRSSNDLEDRDGNRIRHEVEKKKIDEVSRFAYASGGGGNFYEKKRCI